MQIAQEDATASAALGVALPESSTGGRSPYSEYKLIRRNGKDAVAANDKLPGRLLRQGRAA